MCVCVCGIHEGAVHILAKKGAGGGGGCTFPALATAVFKR